MDYNKLKFKAGLEIHQQIDSSKLFCNCPSLLRKDAPDFVVHRKLHAVAGESGEVDVAAKHEAKKDLNFVYEGYDTTCLIELDEEPPHEINQEALKIAVQISLLFNCEIVPITQIMRKTVVDGSNTSGFQRTVLIGRDGFVETSFGKVGISFVYLEEDACRKIAEGTFRMDRLGIPLVEVVTAPDIKNPEQAKELALKIGELLRSCKVRRGIGTIRQDVNVSIKGENRVEIKGMQDMGLFVNIIENEVVRQKKLSEEGKPVEMEVRNALKNGGTSFMRPLPGSARMYPETDLPLLKISRDFLNQAKKDLPKLRSDIKKDLKGQGLDEGMIKLLLKKEKLSDFIELSKIVNKPTLIARMILVYPKEISKHSNVELEKVENLLEGNYPFVLQELKAGKISDKQVKDFLEKIVEGKDLKEIKFEEEDANVVEEFVCKIVKEKSGLNPNAYMGLVMKEFKGKVDGSEVMKIIQRYSN